MDRAVQFVLSPDLARVMNEGWGTGVVAVVRPRPQTTPGFLPQQDCPASTSATLPGRTRRDRGGGRAMGRRRRRRPTARPPPLPRGTSGSGR